MRKKVLNSYKLIDDNTYELHIIRTDGQELSTYIDVEDFNFISNWNWTFKLDKVKNKEYDYRIRATTGPYKSKDLSTILLNNNKETNMMVDHIDRNTLNNKRSNLRLVSRSINATNAQPRIESKTNIRGVYYRKERPGTASASWICEWSIEGKRYSKSYSIKKYGYEEAFKLACLKRQKELEKMKIQSSPLGN